MVLHIQREKNENENENENFFPDERTVKTLIEMSSIFLLEYTDCTAWHPIRKSVCTYTLTSIYVYRERETSIYMCYQSRNCHQLTCG